MQTSIYLAKATNEVFKYSDNTNEKNKPKKRSLCSSDKKHHELYQKIIDFSLDNAKAKTPFSARLAIDNAWSFNYTKQLIEEYKRFLFLMIAAGHKVSPSDQIDQAWHLHMMYSHIYWEEFCGNTVHKKLHHWPAEGNGEFHDWYTMTINSYIRFFGYRPPENIWPDPDIRFKTRSCFVRIDREKNWILPKLNVTGCIKNIFKNICL
jgi:hypothetical protein